MKKRLLQEHCGASPKNLNANCQEDESNNPEDSMDGLRIDFAGDRRSVGIGVVHHDAKNHDGKDQSQLIKDADQRGGPFRMGGKGQRDDDGARAGGEGKGKWVKSL